MGLGSFLTQWVLSSWARRNPFPFLPWGCCFAVSFPQGLSQAASLSCSLPSADPTVDPTGPLLTWAGPSMAVQWPSLQCTLCKPACPCSLQGLGLVISVGFMLGWTPAEAWHGMVWLTPLLYQKQLPRVQSLGVNFGKSSRFPSSEGAVPLQRCYLNGLRKLCHSKVPSGLMVAPTPLSQAECGVQTH